jgi:hypothetical protein
MLVFLYVQNFMNKFFLKLFFLILFLDYNFCDKFLWVKNVL